MHLRQCVLSVLIILAVFSRPSFAAWPVLAEAQQQPSRTKAKRQQDQPPAAPPTEGTITNEAADQQADPNAQGSSAQTGEVKIEVEKFGCGKVARPGEWTGFRIRVFDTSSKPREVLVRLNGKDPDGDIPVAQRDITTNPNVWQGVWMYERLPFSFNLQDLLSVSCYEAVEVKDNSGVVHFEPGKRLGQVRIAPQQLVESGDDIIAVVGQRMAGLNNYSVRAGSRLFPPYSHEPTELVALGPPTELPDRWLGLSQFSTIVWTAGDPADLRGDRAAALREWINRGGHLVIVLPTVGQTWTNSTNNELYDLLPAVSIARQENVDLAPYRSLLTHSTKVALPRNTVLHTFKPKPDAAQGEAVQVLNTPAVNGTSECLVARRLVGTGAVTLIGFDLNNRELVDFGGVDADIFWNRVLGRRGEFPSISELTPILNQAAVATSRSPVSVDIDIQSQINHTATAGAGVLLGFLTFTAYWLLAGPVGFFLLKNYTKHQFSWLAFIAVGVVFTAISWIGAALLRPGKTEATHLTFLDHVYGQPTQRARAWMQVLVPHYGDATIAVGDAGDKNAQHAITAWEPRSNSGMSAFTDTQEYTIDNRAQSTMTVPVRATIKQVQIDWAGSARWKMPIPVKPQAKEGSPPPSDEAPALKLAKIRRDNRELEVLTGTLVHELPHPLTDVRIILIRRQAPVSGRKSDQVPASANIYALSSPWSPGTPLDLESVTSETKGSLAGEVIKSFMPPPTSGSQFGASLDEQPSPNQLLNRLLATALFPMLEPPSRVQQIGTTLLAYQRSSTHGYDLGRWFTQPCVIIIGQLGEGTGKDGRESPVPITIDGAPLATRGRTVVRWVYPLPDSPPDVYPPQTTEDPATISPGTPAQPTDSGSNQ